jgi:hypothetical protein
MNLGQATRVVVETTLPFVLGVSQDGEVSAQAPGPVSVLPSTERDDTVVVNLRSGMSVQAAGISIGSMTGGALSTGSAKSESVSETTVFVPTGMNVVVPRGLMTLAPNAGALEVTES